MRTKSVTTTSTIDMTPDQIEAEYQKLSHWFASKGEKHIDCNCTDCRTALLLTAMRAEMGRLREDAEKEERDHLKTIDERDKAEECIGALYAEVMGEWPEWSNMFGYQDAIDAVSERMEHAKVTNVTLLESEISDLKRHKQQALAFVSELYADRGEDARTSDLCNKAMAVLKP